MASERKKTIGPVTSITTACSADDTDRCLLGAHIVEHNGTRAFLAPEVLRRRYERAVAGHFALTAHMPEEGDSPRLVDLLPVQASRRTQLRREPELHSHTECTGCSVFAYCCLCREPRLCESSFEVRVLGIISHTNLTERIGEREREGGREMETDRHEEREREGERERERERKREGGRETERQTGRRKETDTHRQTSRQTQVNTDKHRRT